MGKKTKKPSSKGTALIAAFSALGTTIGVDVESAFAEAGKNRAPVAAKDAAGDSDASSLLQKYRPTNQYKIPTADQDKTVPSLQYKITSPVKEKVPSAIQRKIVPAVQYKITRPTKEELPSAVQRKIVPAEQQEKLSSDELKIDPGIQKPVE